MGGLGWHAGHHGGFCPGFFKYDRCAAGQWLCQQMVSGSGRHGYRQHDPAGCALISSLLNAGYFVPVVLKSFFGKPCRPIPMLAVSSDNRWCC